VSSIEKLKAELAKAAKIPEPASRSVNLASILAEALRVVGQDPVLVGGAAVEFYTEGGYTTGDIDMLAPGGPELIRVMLELGFEKYGKDFSNEAIQVYVEFPGSFLKGDEKEITVKIGSRLLRVISIEDLIVDRLSAFKFWQVPMEGLNTMKLLETGEVDEARLQDRVKKASVNDALQAILSIREEVIRKKLSPENASHLLEKKMKALK